MALSSLESSPREVLEEIVLWLVASSFLGPPTDIITLQLLSKHVWMTLALRDNKHLYARIFPLKFDINAIVHGPGGGGKSHLELSAELVKRFQALKRLRNGSYDDNCNAGSLRVDLWTAYSMFLESDVNNSRQLIEYADVGRFASEYVSLGGRLHHGAAQNYGWIVDSEENALALWIFWFTDKERVLCETTAERHQLLQALNHLFVGSFKYASTYAPITSFHIPPATPLPVVTATRVPSLPASSISLRCLIAQDSGLGFTHARPLMVPPALLSCVVRLEASISEVDWPLPNYIPATRSDAIAIGWHGPTREDRMKQKVPTTKFVEWGREDLDMKSKCHQQDWMRLRCCYDPWDRSSPKHPMFTPGMLHGNWVGRWFGVSIDEFNELLLSEQTGKPVTTSHPPLVYPVPMQFRLQEHYQRDPYDVVGVDDISCDGTGKGAFNAWFPEGTWFTQINNGLEVHTRHAKKPCKYQTYNPYATASRPALDDEQELHPYDDGILDIILTAQTDEDFAAAWGPQQFYGRIRAWDGLIVLVRVATEVEGQWIFRGYLQGMQNLVGLWRETGTPIEIPAWGGVWSMSKVDVV